MVLVPVLLSPDTRINLVQPRPPSTHHDELKDLDSEMQLELPGTD